MEKNCVRHYHEVQISNYYAFYTPSSSGGGGEAAMTDNINFCFSVASSSLGDLLSSNNKKLKLLFSYSFVSTISDYEQTHDRCLHLAIYCQFNEI